MKTYKNLYNKVCSLENLKKAFKKARKGKSQRSYVKTFEENLKENLLRLKAELEALAYKPKPLRRFVIKDPKTRLISAPHFRDRVVHHALCNVIEPIFDKIFIHDSYASRKGKGTHAVVRRFDKFKRKVSYNSRLVNRANDNNMVIGYVLKADIRHYYASVDHQILLQVIEEKVRDKGVLWLIGRILEAYTEKPDQGMPIGSLTSQLFANVYLNRLDYFVKHQLRAKYYIRYMDDFVLLDKSKDVLVKHKKEIGNFLETIKLTLHPEKSKIFPFHKGTKLVGYRVFFHYKLLNKSNLKIQERRMRRFRWLYVNGEMPREKAVQSLESWMAHARHADTYNLRRRIMKEFNQAFSQAR